MKSDFQRKLSVWRLKSKEGMMETTLELAHQETLHPSPFVGIRSFVSEKYIVSQFGPMGIERDLSKMVTEIRFAVDFTVIHNFEREMSPPYSHNCFHFFNNILAISIFESERDQSKIK